MASEEPGETVSHYRIIRSFWVYTPPEYHKNSRKYPGHGPSSRGVVGPVEQTQAGQDSPFSRSKNLSDLLTKGDAKHLFRAIEGVHNYTV